MSTPDRPADAAHPHTPEPADTDPAGDLVVIEAPTAQLALEQVAGRLGEQARILSAEKVVRGGLAGFFGRELVQIRAQRQPTPPRADLERPAAGGPTTMEAPADRRPEGLQATIARLAREADGMEQSFQDALARQLARTAPLDPTRCDRPVLAPPDGDDRPGPSGTGAPDWSLRHLRALGLPETLLRAVTGLDPDDDLAWVQALAGAVSGLCRPLPGGAELLVGPLAPRLAAHLGIATVDRPGSPPEGGRVCLRLRDGAEDRAWLSRVGAGRPTHLVVGGGGWRWLVFTSPQAVSWVGDEGLVDALALCDGVGAPLGYGLAAGAAGEAWRANPVDVALTLRRLLPRR